MLNVLLVGCGAMGSALNQGWSTRSYLDVTIIDPFLSMAHHAVEDLHPDYRPDVIVFAVKPQMIHLTLPQYKIFTDHNPLFVSIAAGITIETIATYMGPQAKIIRAMPNLPATVGQGMTALVSSHPLGLPQKDMLTDLFAAVGQVAWLADEGAIDVVTALSGSGPAYFFRLTECLSEAGIQAGLSPEMAALLAAQTLIGSGMILQKSTFSPKELREKVTSPGGTTDAALCVFNHQNALENLVNAAVQAAITRARELNSPHKET